MMCTRKGCFVETSAFTIARNSRVRVWKKRSARQNHTFSEAFDFPNPCLMNLLAFPSPLLYTTPTFLLPLAAQTILDEAIVCAIAPVYLGLPADYFSSEICVPCGTRPACWPALLAIHCHLNAETIAMKALGPFWMRWLSFTLLALIAATVLFEKQSPPKNSIGGDGLPSAGTLGPVYASPTQVKLVDLIPASLSGEANQDSEPFLAIQTANPQVMVASAFTPNPVS